MNGYPVTIKKKLKEVPWYGWFSIGLFAFLVLSFIIPLFFNDPNLIKSRMIMQNGKNLLANIDEFHFIFLISFFTFLTVFLLISIYFVFFQKKKWFRILLIPLLSISIFDMISFFYIEGVFHFFIIYFRTGSFGTSSFSSPPRLIQIGFIISCIVLFSLALLLIIIKLIKGLIEEEIKIINKRELFVSFLNLINWILWLVVFSILISLLLPIEPFWVPDAVLLIIFIVFFFTPFFAVVNEVLIIIFIRQGDLLRKKILIITNTLYGFAFIFNLLLFTIHTGGM